MRWPFYTEPLEPDTEEPKTVDPKAALITLLEAIKDRDTITAEDTLDDLLGWVVDGGFIPPELDAAIAALRT